MRTCYTLLLLMLCCHVARAQCPSNQGQWELTGGMGFLTSAQLFYGTAVSKYNFVPNATTQYQKGPAYVITLKHFVGRGFATGGTVVSSSITGDIAFSDKHYQIYYSTAATEFYYVYNFLKYVETYSTLGLGQTWVKKVVDGKTISETNNFSFHYTPFGMRVGGNIAAYAEFGIGYKGLFSCGLSVKVGKRPCWWRAR